MATQRQNVLVAQQSIQLQVLADMNDLAMVNIIRSGGGAVNCLPRPFPLPLALLDVRTMVKSL